ncbi:MAG: YdbL family protein [Pseudomonadales bacterium]|nr:YdbL family protein [Pseudomonadales bacterium]
MKTLKLLISAVLMTTSLSLFALDLDSAKAQGVVGEKTSGYLGIPNRQEVDAQVIDLIKSVNNKRKAKYTEIAAKNNLKPSEIAKMAHKKAVAKTKAGNFYQKEDGSWLKK